MTSSIYLDSNATTQVMPQALAAASLAMEAHFGTPSSTHSDGLVARDLLDQARQAATQVLGAGDGDVMFNSGATEGIQTAVLSALCAIRERRADGLPTGKLLVYGATEHKAVPQALAHWNHILGLGLEMRALPVDASGRHDLHTLSSWLPRTAMLCTMAANNETGVVTDLAAIGCLLRAAPDKPLWLVDGVQALGKLDMNLQASAIDYAVFSGHKLFAPKGVGILYVRRGAPFTPLMVGGGQEAGLRGGTENMPGIAALGAVLQALLAGQGFASHATLCAWRDQLVRSLRQAFPAAEFNAPLDLCLPTTLNFAVPGVSGKTMLDVFDAAGLRVSAGSACSAAKAAPSFVLEAMGLPLWRAGSAVRLSISATASQGLIDSACEAIAHCGWVLAAMQNPSAQEATQPQVAGDHNVSDRAGESDSSQDAAAFTLHWGELDAFLRRHPDATLVDVREDFEHQASGGLQLGGHNAISAPASTLATTLDDSLPPTMPAWAAAGSAPVVLVCRSGNRSLRVARWLQMQGHTAVRHVHGGLALRP